MFGMGTRANGSKHPSETSESVAPYGALAWDCVDVEPTMRVADITAEEHALLLAVRAMRQAERDHAEAKQVTRAAEAALEAAQLEEDAAWDHEHETRRVFDDALYAVKTAD